MKHKLVAIGYLGCMHVYLDISEEEALRRYTEVSGPLHTFEYIKTIFFDDEFETYDVWEV